MKKFLSLIMILIVITVKAQNPPPTLNTSMIPPSPDAASLGKYGIFPVTLYSGSANISVPIAEVKTSKLNLPISLGYNYNGYRPGEEASSVGLGWSLQAGGVITRVLKAKADDDLNLTNRWYDYANLADVYDNPDFLTNIALGNIETEPDIYIFSFNGYSGKFILVGERAVLIPKQDLVITSFGSGAGFYIHTPDGAIYKFEDKEITDSYPSGGNNIPDYTSSWFLTSIRSEHSPEIISFTYTTWKHKLPNGNYSDNLVKQTGPNVSGGPCNLIPCFTWNSTSFFGPIVWAKRLVSISSSQSSVNFIYDNVLRKDIDREGSENAYALKRIEVYNKPANEMVKKINLNTGYFGPPNNNTFVQSHLKLNSVQVTGYKYKKVYAQTITEILQQPPHVFTYNNEELEYPKITRGIDRWGYYNGVNNNPTLFDTDIPETIPTYIQTGDRAVNPALMQNGILNKITYPTGGYSTFEYENNLIRLPNVTDDEVPENRTSTVTTVNPTGVEGTATQFYTNTGYFTINRAQNITVDFGRTLFTNQGQTLPVVTGPHRIVKLYWLDPQYEIDDPNAPPFVLVDSSPALGPSLLSAQFITSVIPGHYKYVVTCAGNVATTYASFSYIYYNIVAYMGSPGPGMRIKTINSFDNINNATPQTVKTYTYGNGGKILAAPIWYQANTVQRHTSGVCGNYFLTTYNSEYSSSLNSLSNEQFYYPIVTEINKTAALTGKTEYEYYGNTDQLNVNLIKQTQFQATGGSSFQKINEVSNTYGDPYNGSNFMVFFGLRQRLTDETVPCGIEPFPYLMYFGYGIDIEHRNKLYAADQYSLFSIPNLLLTTIEKNYDGSPANPITKNTTYFYESTAHLNPTKITVNNSKGEIITTQMKYPLDYNILGCPSLTTIDNNFKISRDAVSNAYFPCKSNRYTTAINNHILPSPPRPGFYNNPGNQPLQYYLLTQPCETNYKANYLPVLNSFRNSGVTAYSCFNPTNYPNANGAIINMQRFNNQTPIEKIVSITKGGSTWLQSSTKTNYKLFNYNGDFWTQPNIIYATEARPNTVLLNDFMNDQNNYYKPRVEFKFNNTNLIEQSKISDVKMAYVWDYNDNFAIAQVTNAATEDIAATSFESNGKGGFTSLAGTLVDDQTAVTGTKYFQSFEPISKTGLNPAKTYIVSYWSNNGQKNVNSTSGQSGRTFNGFTYYEHKVINPSGGSITISNNGGSIDELRLYPEKAQMTTYTYQPLTGVTSQCDANNRIIYYEYDALSRLSIVRDQDNNILKKICYNYAGQPENCGGGTSCTNTNPDWQNTTAPPTCQQGSCGNTGYQIQEQRDMNPCSSSYNALQTVPVYNPTACPIQTCPPAVSLTSTMVSPAPAYTARYYNANTDVTFAVTATTGLQPLGSIPAGNYTLIISRTGSNPPEASFKSGCFKQTITGTSATFFNVNVSSTTCNSITIDLTVGI